MLAPYAPQLGAGSGFMDVLAIRHETQYSALQINAFMTITATAQCSCPARVCGAIVDMRELHDYQLNSRVTPAGDDKVHAALTRAIVRASKQAHAILEDCLTEILETEGIDPNMTPISHLSKD